MVDGSLIEELEALLTIDAEGKCRGLYDAGVTDAILVARQHMGDASTRKDEDSKTVCASPASIGGEIPVVEAWPECGKCKKPLWKKSFPDNSFYYEACSTCEPNSSPKPVSIEGAVTKLMENAEEYSAPVNKFRAMRFAQICAKAWGLSHVD